MKLGVGSASTKYGAATELAWQVIRQGKWKAIRRNLKKDPEAPIVLYDLEADPTESTDVAGQHPEIVAVIADIMRVEHTPSPVERWNF